MRGEEGRHLKHFVLSLDGSERRILMLRFAEEFSPAEISVILRLPEAQIASILDRVVAHARAWRAAGDQDRGWGIDCTTAPPTADAAAVATGDSLSAGTPRLPVRNAP